MEIPLRQLTYIRILIGAYESINNKKRTPETALEITRQFQSLTSFFILKSKTASPVIQNWQQQRDTILTECQLTEQEFLQHLATLEEMKLIIVRENKNICLCSFHVAARKLKIKFSGIKQIEYTPALPGLLRKFAAPLQQTEIQW